MSKINGVLLPGGSVDMFQKGGYIEAAEEIMDIATEFNNQKDIFPVFGVGLGMDIMLDKSTEAQDISRECQLDLMAVSLILSKKGELIRDLKAFTIKHSFQIRREPRFTIRRQVRHQVLSIYLGMVYFHEFKHEEHIKRIISSHPVAVLNAKKCYPKDVFEMSNLANLWIPFSYNLDRNGKMIVMFLDTYKVLHIIALISILRFHRSSMTTFRSMGHFSTARRPLLNGLSKMEVSR